MINNEYVWYACYGSNINRHRFMCYIKGGTCLYNGVQYPGCKDKRDPVEDRPVFLPHRLYFANSSSKWSMGGVAFIDPKRGKRKATLGRMYLITTKQFDKVKQQEGAWYGQEICLGEEDGYMIKTFTHPDIQQPNAPDAKYLLSIMHGLQEIYPKMPDQKICEYLSRHLQAWPNLGQAYLETVIKRKVILEGEYDYGRLRIHQK